MLLDQLWTNSIEVTSGGRWVVVVWLGILGGALGSFMNVVVYRLPRGMSLLRPGSRCPACGHAIRWHDNLPVLGWLLLGGRCRDCHQPISPRYPLIELTVMVASAVLAWSNTARGGALDANIEPFFAFDLRSYTADMLLVCTLICAALIEFDDQLVPLGMLGLALIAVALLPLIWSPAPIGIGVAWPTWERLAPAALGVLTATCLAMLAWPAWVSGRARGGVHAGLRNSAELLLSGLVLGSAAVAAIGSAAMTLLIVLRALGRFRPTAARFRWASSLTLATMTWLFFFRQPPAVGGSQTVENDVLAAVIAGGILMALLALAARWIVPPANTSQRGP